MSHFSLTPEQQRVVAHNTGPALVFAVAGAGKTTAMVHRIQRLVKHRVFAPQRILATSFSRATVQDIRTALMPWRECAEVQVATLHAVGLRVLNYAADRGLIPPPQIAGEGGTHSERALLRQALGKARQQRLELPPSLDEQDFLSYVGMCKGSFAYPEAGERLPDSARVHITQAKAPDEMDYYVELYTIFERTRRQLGLITFDDMLLSAWEVLQCHPEVLEAFQGFYDCVIVDEFQDVNAVQSEVLDLLTRRHGNYMVIGDDDQTIYEWRGASPRFILTFPERYQAKKYLLRENFRSQASHLALANRMIAHNQQREPKQLHLTRGFGGKTEVRHVSDEMAQARQLVTDIMRSCQAGYRFEQQAILVRLYAQSPYLEQALIESLIPYRLVGSVPFYQRQEIRTLVEYLRLAQTEFEVQQARERGETLDPNVLLAQQRRWLHLANRPVRYLNRHWLDWVHDRIGKGESLLLVLRQLADQADTPYQRKLVTVLADILKDLLATGLNTDAGTTLTRLETDLRYCSFLRKSSGFPETGEGRARTVEAFLDYATGKGTPQQLEQHLQELAQAQRHDDDSVILTTIFRAKGLEWPVVYIPHCNQGYIPYSSGHSIEEERRLFYVALTRPREHLHLYVLDDFPISRFLIEAAHDQTLSLVEQTAQSLAQAPAQWSIDRLLGLLRSQPTLMLHRYLAQWWTPAAEHKALTLDHLCELAILAQAHASDLDLDAEHLGPWLALPPSDTTSVGESVWSAPLADYLERQRTLKAVTVKTAAPAFYEVGESVWSERFGSGQIIAYDPEHDQGALLEVRFESGELRQLLARYARLERVS